MSEAGGSEARTRPASTAAARARPRLRAHARAALAFLTALGASLALWLAWSLAGLLPARGRARARPALVRAWGRALLAAFGARLRIEGERPRAGLIVANHSSYLDVLALCAATGARFVAAVELSRWPLVGAMARSAGTLFVERARKRALAPVAERLEEALRAGELIVLFPEGRSTPGDALHPFRPSLLEAAARSGAPVHAAALHYRTRAPAPPAGVLVPWIDGAPFLPHALALAATGALEARLRFGRTLADDDRKRLGRACEQAVGELFEPLAGARGARHSPERGPP